MLQFQILPWITFDIIELHFLVCIVLPLRMLKCANEFKLPFKYMARQDIYINNKKLNVFATKKVLAPLAHCQSQWSLINHCKFIITCDEHSIAASVSGVGQASVAGTGAVEAWELERMCYRVHDSTT